VRALLEARRRMERSYSGRLFASLYSAVLAGSLLFGCSAVRPQGDAKAPSGASQSPAPPSRSTERIDVSSEQAFTTSVVDRLRRTVPQARIEVQGPLALDVVAPEGTNLRVNLDRIWGFCQESPSECLSEVEALEHMLREAGTPEEVSGEKLVLAIRTRNEVAGLPDLGPKLLVEPFVGELVVVAMVDLKNSARYANDTDLEKLGLTRQAALELARKNVLEHLGATPALGADGTAGKAIGVILRNDFYESSRLLDTAGWARVAGARPEALIVGVPSNDVIVLQWTNDPADIKALRAVVATMAKKAPRPLSVQLLRWNDRGFTAL
jgi:hypothetical protein